MKADPAKVQAFVAQAQADPSGFLRTMLGVTLWPRQDEIVTAVRDHERVAVRSCHASGKTFVAADVALWFLYAFPRSLVITTGPSYRQIRDNLWGEIQRAYNAAPYPLGAKTASWAQCRLVIDGKWQAIGFSTDRAERFSGWHANHILVIVDEASGVHQDIFDGIEGLQSAGTTVRRLLISQGTQVGGGFYDAFHKERALWRCFKIGAQDTPNFAPEVLEPWVAAGKPERWTWPYPYLIKPSWVESRKTAWGVGTPLWLVKVEGEFPPADPYAIISLADAENAAKRELTLPDKPLGQIGVDIARTGLDLTVVYARRGPNVVYVATGGYTLGPQVEGMVAEAVAKTGIRRIVGDADGVGGPILDYMRANHKEWEVVDFHSAGKPRDVDTYSNAKAEAWAGVAQRFRDGDISYAGLRQDQQEELIADLVVVRKEFDGRGRVKMQDKETLKREIGHSPDRGDALMLAFHTVGSFSDWTAYMKKREPAPAAVPALERPF